MMKTLINAQRLQAMRAMTGQVTSRLAIVTSYDPANYAVRVQLQPEGTMSGWLPLASPWVGNGWGMFCAPSINEMVTIVFMEGQLESGVVVNRLFNDEDRPLAVDSGEFWLVHESGAFFKLQNDGAATFSDGHGANVTLNGDGTITSAASDWTHTGPKKIVGTLEVTGNITGDANITATGNVADQGGAKTMAGMRTVYDTHTHGENGAPGPTDPPNSPM